MIVNLYYPSDINNNLITFSIFNAINSISITTFEINEAVPTYDLDNVPARTVTRLVSGYERARRSINIVMKCIRAPPADRSLLRNSYIVSCVRLPFVCVKLMMNKQFSRAVLPVVVDCNKEIQVWHIFGVAKNHEPGSLQKIKGVNVCQDGVEVYYDKELIVLSGNIPASFIAALSKTTTYVEDIGMAAFVYPFLSVNREDATIVTF
ncbi:EP23 [Rachiplusia nu nucleopolyhedrovirus]|uniref:EP23 n=1 Tax=Rachiplusia nu nucleopolyhedrovirus TaxID=2605775 RepID=A0AAE6IQQ0_9ABAC|nr:EP23 [Rachiplusia nu nucleopolyhedrovirus]QEI03643.1 EP23 [Rachiplusia nu nucleopolyhedrovirus]